MDNKTITPEQFTQIRTRLGMSQQKFAEMLGYKNMMSISMKETGAANITQRDMLLLEPHLYMLTVPDKFFVENTVKVIDMHLRCFLKDTVTFLKMFAIAYEDKRGDIPNEPLFGIHSIKDLIEDKLIKKPSHAVMEEIDHIITILNFSEAPYLRIIHS